MAALGRQGGFEPFTQGLHRALEVPQAQRCLGHGQHAGAVEGSGALGRFLRVKAQLQIQEAPQALIAAATAQAQQVGHACEDQGPAGEIGWSQCPQQLPQVPEGAGWQHRIAPGE